ncbi:hypothetical protein V2W45_1349744 [Cenococcum geophilum]
MSAWYDKPHTTMVAGFGYNVEAFRKFEYEACGRLPLQMLLGTGSFHLQQPTTVYRSWPSSKEDSCSKKGECTIARFYGVVDESGAPGLTWEEIADLIDQHIKMHGKIENFVE